jgi:ubiquinone/menaquinone biosynthesis C-methylase UbiE
VTNRHPDRSENIAKDDAFVKPTGVKLPRLTLSPDALIRLPERGANALPEIMRMARYGDWQTRAWALSAAGRIARGETFAARAWRWVARRVPGLRHRFPSAGFRGRYVRNEIANALQDRSWPVRVAAAFALGECRTDSQLDHLMRQLAAPHRAERIAAAAAILRCGGALPATAGSSLLDNAAPAPASIGDTTRTLDFLTSLASVHLGVLAAWPDVAGADRPAGQTPADWAAFLAGPEPADTYTGREAEIHRYSAEGETEYLLTKPFSRINRAQNVRLLHAFLVVSEHLRVPQEGRVLDLGGGSAWVSELLAKLGYRPFTLDVSSSLLALGRRRFERNSLTPRFMVGDMTALPVATGSMDAAVVLDALHHVPDVPAVFREVFRVLGAGGQFILAEPGEGHAETEKSRGEMLEHGVQEREIHLFEAIEHGRAAGFDDIGAVPHYVPYISMTPEQLRKATVSPSETWMIHQGDRLGYLSPFLIQSMFDHPVLVFRKGRRPIDSGMPGVLKADVSPRLARDRARVTGVVAVRNIGDTTWLGGGDRVGQVQLGIQLLGADHKLLDMEFSRTSLAGHVAPGQDMDIAVDLTLPDPDASFVLKIDLVDEGICWFEDVGSKPVYVPV